MIYLFDKCYLSLPNQVIEDATHVWVGEFNITDKSFFEHTYNIFKSFDKITEAKIDTLFSDIHKKLPDTKVIIYCDVDNFLKIYGFFFGALLSKDGLIELYNYDHLKENYGISDVTVNKARTKTIERITLPSEDFSKLKKTSKFAQTVTELRIELSLPKALMGDSDAFEYCVDRVSKMYKGSLGYNSRFVETVLPALLPEFNISDLLTEGYIQSKVSEFTPNEHLPRVEDKIRQIIGFDVAEHFAHVINDGDITTEEYLELMETYVSKDKREYVKDVILNPSYAKNYQLMFPTVANFDSVNPILWNAIFKNSDNTEWLEKFNLNYGTDNQTDGTV